MRKHFIRVNNQYCEHFNFRSSIQINCTITLNFFFLNIVRKMYEEPLYTY